MDSFLCWHWEDLAGGGGSWGVSTHSGPSQRGCLEWLGPSTKVSDHVKKVISDLPQVLILSLRFSYPLSTLSEKAMATHSSTLAWKIPWMEEPGRLQSMGSLRVGHDWVTSLSLFTFMHWRRKWQPVFLPGESQGRQGLVGCRLWGRTESDTTEVT